MLRQPVQWSRDHPKTADALLAGLLGLLSIVGLLTVDPEVVSPETRDPDALAVAICILVWAAVAVRRRWPEAVAWTVSALIIPYWALNYLDAGVMIGVLVGIYSLAAHVDRPRSSRVGVVIVSGLVAVMLLGVATDEEELTLAGTVANTIVLATAWIAGDSVRNRRAYLVEVEARAEAAEHDRELAAARAVQDERVRIARELHDVVAHTVSVMVVQAAAGRRVLDRDPARAAEALGVIEGTGREALRELRHLLGVLRDEDPEPGTEPQPGAADVADLVRRCREAGVDVGFEVVGDPALVPSGVGLTAYRVVQEALTNVVRHAGPARVDVRLAFGEVVSIEVTDDGRGPLTQPDPSAGQGLIGMRERVELFGGELQVGPRPGGGFRVRATLPVAEVARA